MFDVRKLNVGDFLWIAREKTTPQPGLPASLSSHLEVSVDDFVCSGRLTLPESREAVLEYIIERKRMDDLAGSIIDGRFREQKAGLLSSLSYNVTPCCLISVPSEALWCEVPHVSGGGV